MIAVAGFSSDLYGDCDVVIREITADTVTVEMGFAPPLGTPATVSIGVAPHSLVALCEVVGHGPPSHTTVARTVVFRIVRVVDDRHAQSAEAMC